MKKKNIIFTIIIVAVVIVAVVLGFVFGPKKNNTTGQYDFKSTKELYAFSVVSGLELANNYTATATLATQTELDNMVDSIHSYLPSMEGFLGGSNVIVPQEQDSDDPEYDRMLVVDYSDMTGDEAYTIYFTEVAQLSNGDVRPWREDDDFEVKTSLRGVVKKGGQTYALSGIKEVEKGEIEISFEMVVDGRLIQIEQETENNEQEFEYTLYNGENKASGVAYSHGFGIEVNRGMVEIETEYEKPASQGQPAVNIELEIKQANADNNNVFYIEYEENNKKVRMTVEKTTTDGSVTYTYKMGEYTATKVVTL